MDTNLSIDEVYRNCQSNQYGGNVLFIGTVRQRNKNKEVDKLDFETYKEMALKTMQLICHEAKEKFGVGKVIIHHRSGEVRVGEIAVIIGVSAVHRKEAFEACSYAIDQLKLRVPIWKKEFLEDGAYWVSDRP